MIAKCFEHLIFVALTAFEKEKENNSTGNFLILHEEDLVDLNQSLKLVWVQVCVRTCKMKKYFFNTAPELQ